MGAMNEFTEGPLTLDEMLKIVSLLDNPPEGMYMRKALRFYDVPDGETKWEDFKQRLDLMRAHSGRYDKVEMAELLKHLDDKDSVLEVGAGFGEALKQMASVMRKGAVVVAVAAEENLPEALNPIATLKENCRKLCILGANVEVFIGNRNADSTVDAVGNYAPFDLIFVNEKTTEAMQSAWEKYGPMGRIIAFHNIIGAQFWSALVLTGNYKTQEIINPGDPRYGIGLVFLE